MTYNYLDAVKADVREFFEGNIDYLDVSDFENIDRFCDYLVEDLSSDDDITGYRDGSYTLSPWVAQECLEGNYALMDDAAYALHISDPWKDGAEKADAMIRYYVLPDAVYEVALEYGLRDRFPQEARQTGREPDEDRFIEEDEIEV